MDESKLDDFLTESYSDSTLCDDNESPEKSLRSMEETVLVLD